MKISANTLSFTNGHVSTLSEVTMTKNRTLLIHLIAQTYGIHVLSEQEVGQGEVSV